MVLIDGVFLLLIVMAVVATGSWVFGISARKQKPELITREELRALRQRASIAEQGLRKIANGAGNPLLEAQSSLDEIENTYEIKELN